MNREIIFKSRPVGMVSRDNFEIKEVSGSYELHDGEVLVRALYISVDPYMRGRMSDSKSYIPPFETGKPLEGGVVAEVVESKSGALSKGEVVLGNLPWKEEQVVRADKLNKVDANIAPASYYLGILGMPGLTAYLGLTRIGAPKSGETVVISGAAGAVGSVVGQIAKIMGCHVVGIAGSEEKANFLKNELGFDAVINYKTAGDLSKAVAECCPNGVDVYYDNVGGEVSDAVLLHINRFARIILCGQISLYNSTEMPMGPRPQVALVKNSALMKGFIVNDYNEYYPEAIKQLAEWIKEGKLLYHETVLQGFDKLPEAFIGLFEGRNTGKLLVKVSK
ncbi:NADP-dependent oxidoreductase [Porphyromonas pogonae]|uniref:NADP-dependent oxidoreductase n=1 Tax=Porphyromonas pogonae TaxID=867595 RepID=UPI002E76ADFC|nr:NADP-dependent oxidoreductase [Porphyromonas pogonae]